MSEKSDLKQIFSLPVIVAALGYFVDIYDMQLFGIVRVPSLESLGYNEAQVSDLGKSILNFQMVGLLLGGIIWGVLGDKKGRLSVLFGSIITYSIANILCGLIPQITFMDQGEAYKWLRFFAGIGLAGELGAGITLVSESLPKHLRAIGTSMVAGVGLMGAVVGNFTVKLSGDWTIAYFIGGIMGFALLFLRINVFESGIYKKVLDNKQLMKGNFLSFFTNKERFIKYLKCIGIGMPTWFCIGILAYFANEFGEALGIPEKISPGTAIMWAYIGISAGDFLSGFISHYYESRKKAIAVMMAFSLFFVIIYLFAGIKSANLLYAVCWCLGFGTGYWAMFVTVAAEQFGTNLRATAATTIPNMVRGSVPIMVGMYSYFKPSFGTILAGGFVAIFAYIIGFYSTLTVEETHDKDLNFNEI